MKLIRTEDAAGQVLCQDITQIIQGVTKDAVFRKGHVVTAEDIPVLLSVGKEHLYVWEDDEAMLHEDDAAAILRDLLINENMTATLPKEGKIELIADCDGLFLADIERLKKLNSLGQMMAATHYTGCVVKKGEKLCGTRVIPLRIEKSVMEAARAAIGPQPLLRLLPLKPKKFGAIITGSEVSKGLIRDTFTHVLQQKLGEYGGEMIDRVVLGDDDKAITGAIRSMLEKGAELILCTGGMSVDPDDRTPVAIRNAGVRVVSHGSPVLPGAMFLLSYAPNGVPVCGLPGGVMYAKRSVFDLVLPYLLADVPVTADMLAALGDGGMCLNCPECRFPNCGFGKCGMK